MLQHVQMFFSRIDAALSTFIGWFIAVAGVLGNYFLGNEFSVYAIFIVVFLDAFWGIYAAICQHRFAKSELMRDTFTKISAYGTAIIILIAVEKLTGIENHWPVGITASLICLTELWSIGGNILIVNHNITFFRLLRPLLKGEIANKLKISEDKIDEYFEADDEHRKRKVEEKKKHKKDKSTSKYN